MIAGTKDEVRSIIQKFREAYTDFENSVGSLDGDAMKSDRAAPEQLVDPELRWTLEQPVDPGDPLLISQVHEKLKSHMQELNSDLVAVREGRQLCILSSERTGHLQEGDSGGPLVAQDGKTVIGIASWAMEAEEQEANLFKFPEGTHQRMPGFYTSTSFFRDWLDSTVEALNKAEADKWARI